ncbi:HAD-IIIC family phosphatase [Streptomyces sp. NPDC048611]|uniref:HAD-IIIC family phosphatase n=1 Tax=Streptomyces sp. NPDC048611 TaxID=3155635 RepID=UPI00343DB279
MSSASPAKERRGTVKCLVWDLDDTIWDGVLLEDADVRVRPGVREALAELDARGILHSLASRNDPETALARLTELGLREYFLYPQIGWGAKSHAVAAVAEALNIGVDALAFIDDQPFERDEVTHAHPGVLALDAADVAVLTELPALRPAFVTEDSRRRRHMYQADLERKEAEDHFAGPQDAFLASLDMRLEIARAQESDLQRAEELTVRTNQLNTTGRTYAYDELNALRTSDGYLLLIARLTDRYGPYGNIGLTLVQTPGAAGPTPPPWTIKLLLMSCRVMSRGVGTVLVNSVKRLARDAGAALQAEFIPTDRNRMMYVSFKFNGFRETGPADADGLIRLAADLDKIPDDPSYTDVTVNV